MQCRPGYQITHKRKRLHTFAAANRREARRPVHDQAAHPRGEAAPKSEWLILNWLSFLFDGNLMWFSRLLVI
jgi:hypothetical protein